ncbi:trypsin alpha-like [Pecten maximus]|uniref:trypsin alpha-like n=1 Tax=Pecten maximus TaxID=6579 RepID=UPI001458D3CB|nr:trypsin alpha-like [Pecten maximus]
MGLWLLPFVLSGCLALPGRPTPHHPGQELIDIAKQTYLEGQSRIVGGSDAFINNVPWQASLEVNGNHICGAIILSNRFILTAAHCVGSSSPSSYVVHVGSASRSGPGGSRHSVADLKKHEKFENSATTPDGAFPYDVALLKLSDQITLDTNKAAISLTSVTNTELAGYDLYECLISGWGRTKENSNSPLPDQLQQTNVKILTDSRCSGIIGSSSMRGDIHICVDGEGASGGCNGDSGGPLACKVGDEYQLAGVTSFVFGGCLTSYPTVYAETYAFREWVQTTMNSMSL